MKTTFAKQKMDAQKLKEFIRDVPDFPKKGILFKDITPLLKSGPALHFACEALAKEFKTLEVEQIVGIESRGFIFSPMIAYKLGTGFIPVRKKGKPPHKVERVSYTLEYGEDFLEIHQDAIKPGSRVAIVDDLLATGGTAFAAAHLVEQLGGKVEKFGFLIELNFLKGRQKLAPRPVFSLIQY